MELQDLFTSDLRVRPAFQKIIRSQLKEVDNQQIEWYFIVK